MPNIIAIKELLWTTHPMPREIKIVSFEDTKQIEAADIFVQTNIKECKKQKRLGNIYQYVIDSGKPFICLESAVFRRNLITPPHPRAYHRWSWTSYFRDEGNYCNANSPSDRWQQIQKEQNIEIKDWQHPGDKIVLLLQRPGDSSLKNLIKKYHSYEMFIKTVVTEIRKHTDRKILVRPHPLRLEKQVRIINKLKLRGIEISEQPGMRRGLHGGEHLYNDLKNAWAVVGFNSNALTETVCEGIPTFSLCPSSMAWECSNTNLKDLENPKTFDRQQWLNNLGYCQWRRDECLAGLPLQHLLKGLSWVRK